MYWYGNSVEKKEFAENSRESIAHHCIITIVKLLLTKLLAEKFKGTPLRIGCYEEENYLNDIIREYFI